MNSLSKFFRLIHIPAIILVALITWLSSKPVGLKTQLFENQDKVLHFIAYGFIAFCFCFWVRSKRWKSSPIKYGFIVLMLIFILGLVDEWHQSFVPGRQVSMMDVLADVLGGATAIFIYFKLKIWNRIAFLS